MSNWNRSGRKHICAKSLALHRTHEATYLLAKALAAQQKDDEALEALETAIRLAESYARAMHRDGDFTRLKPRLDALERCLLDQARVLAATVFGELEARCSFLSELALELPRAAPIPLRECCSEEFEQLQAMLKLNPGPGHADLPTIIFFLKRVAGEADDAFNRLVERWKQRRSQELDTASQAMRADRHREVADAKMVLLQGSGIGVGLLVWFGSVIVFSIISLPVAITLLLPPALGAWAGYDLGKEARSAAQEEIWAIEARFDQDEQWLSQVAEAVAGEPADALNPSPSIYLAEWREGPTRCAGRLALEGAVAQV